MFVKKAEQTVRRVIWTTLMVVTAVLGVIHPSAASSEDLTIAAA